MQAAPPSPGDDVRGAQSQEPERTVPFSGRSSQEPKSWDLSAGHRPHRKEIRGGLHLKVGPGCFSGAGVVGNRYHRCHRPRQLPRVPRRPGLAESPRSSRKVDVTIVSYTRGNGGSGA